MKKLKQMDAACAVLALCYVSKKDEEAVLRVATLHGFLPGKGMEDPEWMGAAKTLGIHFKAVNPTPMELRKFIKIFPKDLYFVETPGHLLVVDNSLIIDPRWGSPGLRRKVLNAWKVT